MKYVSPELKGNNKLSTNLFKADVYSLGLILLILCQPKLLSVWNLSD